MRTYKYPLYPNKEQTCKLWLHANKLNWLYNHFLSLKIEAYKKDKSTIGWTKLNNLIPELRNEQPLLNDIYGQSIQQVAIRLDKSYNAFFKQHNKLPKFRGCHKFFGLTYPQYGYKLNDNKFITTAYGTIKFNKHREIQGNIRQVYITNKHNKFYICITTDESPTIVSEHIDTKSIVGVDVGVTNIVALNNGNIIKNTTIGKYYDKQIDKLKSRRDKCKVSWKLNDTIKNGKKYSNKTKYLNKVIKKLYSAKNNKIKDFQHKVSKDLSSNYNTVVIENLKIVKMLDKRLRHKGQNKMLANASMGNFIDMLKYKCKMIIEVNPIYTSQCCNNCGTLQKMPLSERTYKCRCGYIEDRDVNAAKNIKCLGQAMLSKTTCTVNNIFDVFAGNLEEVLYRKNLVCSASR